MLMGPKLPVWRLKCHFMTKLNQSALQRVDLTLKVRPLPLQARLYYFYVGRKYSNAGI